MLRAGGNRNVAAVGERNHPQKVGDKTLLSQKYLDRLGSTHRPVNDFIYGRRLNVGQAVLAVPELCCNRSVAVDLSATFGSPVTSM